MTAELAPLPEHTGSSAPEKKADGTPAAFLDNVTELPEERMRPGLDIERVREVLGALVGLANTPEERVAVTAELISTLDGLADTSKKRDVIVKGIIDAFRIDAGTFQRLWANGNGTRTNGHKPKATEDLSEL